MSASAVTAQAVAALVVDCEAGLNRNRPVGSVFLLCVGDRLDRGAHKTEQQDKSDGCGGMMPAH